MLLIWRSGPLCLLRLCPSARLPASSSAGLDKLARLDYLLLAGSRLQRFDPDCLYSHRGPCTHPPRDLSGQGDEVVRENALCILPDEFCGTSGTSAGASCSCAIMSCTMSEMESGSAPFPVRIVHRYVYLCTVINGSDVHNCVP